MGSRSKVSAVLGARGFTLIELVVALFLIALGVSLAVPVVSRSTETIRARAEVAGFAAVLRHTREQAITSRQRHAVTVDAPEHRLVILADDEVKERRALPARLTVEASVPAHLTVRFEPQGTSSGGDFRLTSGSVTYRVTVDPVTGRVRSRKE